MAGNAGVASTKLVFPRLPPRYLGSEEALLLLPYSLNSVLAVLHVCDKGWWYFKSVCELLKR